MSNVQKIVHKSRNYEVEMVFPTDSTNLTWAFTAENDSVIFDVELVNIGSFLINGNSESLPFQCLKDASYSITIVRSDISLSSAITLKLRRDIDKKLSLNIPNFDDDLGEFLFVMSGGLMHKIDCSLLNSSNYLGTGSWSISPIVDTITPPDLSAEKTYAGLDWTHLWNRACYVIIGGEKYMLVLSTHTTLDVIGSLYNIETGLFYKTDLSALGYTLINTGYAVNSQMASILYDYINNRVMLMWERAAGSSDLLFDLTTGGTMPFGFESTVNQFLHHINAGGRNFRRSFDPYSGEFLTNLGRLKLPEQDTRSFAAVNGRDSAFIRSTGEVAIPFHNWHDINLFDSRGVRTRTLTVGSNSGGSFNGGAIVADDRNSYIAWSSINTDEIKIIDVGGTNGYALFSAMVTTDHNGYRGLIFSSQEKLLFSYGLAGTDSGKRLYVFDSEIRDVGMDLGYLDFAETIDDIYSNQIL